MLKSKNTKFVIKKLCTIIGRCPDKKDLESMIIQ